MSYQRRSFTLRPVQHWGEAHLTDDELHSLMILKDTLTPEERLVIDYHVIATDE